RQLTRLGVHARFLRAARRTPGADAPAVGGPLAHPAVDGGAGRGRDGVPQPEHARRAACPERRVDHLRRPARHLSAGRMVAAGAPGAAMRPAGAARSAAVLVETARRAAAQAGVALPGDAAVVGAAGAGRRQEQAELEAALVDAGVARRVRVLADGEVALTTAFARGPGVLVNAGTGSIAYARVAGGEIHRAGGYGWQRGDA